MNGESPIDQKTSLRQLILNGLKPHRRSSGKRENEDGGNIWGKVNDSQIVTVTDSSSNVVVNINSCDCRTLNGRVSSPGHPSERQENLTGSQESNDMKSISDLTSCQVSLALPPTTHQPLQESLSRNIELPQPEKLRSSETQQPRVLPASPIMTRARRRMQRDSDEGKMKMDGNVLLRGRGKAMKRMLKGFYLTFLGIQIPSKMPKLQKPPKQHHEDQECPVCELTFPWNARTLFQNHLEVHEGFKPFVCPHCKTGYTNPVELIEHVGMMHSSDTSYACESCGKMYKTQRGLHGHLAFRKCRKD